MCKSWRDIAKEVIEQVISATSTRPTQSYQFRVKAAIDAAYPFGQRKYYPYQVWIEERAAAFYQLGIIKKPTNKRFSKAKSPPQQDLVSPGQLSLLELVPPIPAGHGKDPDRVQLPIKLEVSSDPKN